MGRDDWVGGTARTRTRGRSTCVCICICKCEWQGVGGGLAFLGMGASRCGAVRCIRYLTTPVLFLLCGHRRRCCVKNSVQIQCMCNCTNKTASSRALALYIQLLSKRSLTYQYLYVHGTVHGIYTSIYVGRGSRNLGKVEVQAVASTPSYPVCSCCVHPPCTSTRTHTHTHTHIPYTFSSYCAVGFSSRLHELDRGSIQTLRSARDKRDWIRGILHRNLVPRPDTFALPSGHLHFKSIIVLSRGELPQCPKGTAVTSVRAHLSDMQAHPSR